MKYTVLRRWLNTPYELFGGDLSRRTSPSAPSPRVRFGRAENGSCDATETDLRRGRVGVKESPARHRTDGVGTRERRKKTGARSRFHPRLRRCAHVPDGCAGRLLSTSRNATIGRPFLDPFRPASGEGSRRKEPMPVHVEGERRYLRPLGARWGPVSTR